MFCLHWKFTTALAVHSMIRMDARHMHIMTRARPAIRAFSVSLSTHIVPVFKKKTVLYSQSVPSPLLRFLEHSTEESSSLKLLPSSVKYAMTKNTTNTLT
jgi:hypothetical protein